MLQTRTGSAVLGKSRPLGRPEGRDLRLLRAEEEDKGAREQDSAAVGGMLLERGIAGDEHGGRIALEENPQVAVSRVRVRSGLQWGTLGLALAWQTGAGPSYRADNFKACNGPAGTDCSGIQ